jgi:hypothetical protein
LVFILKKLILQPHHSGHFGVSGSSTSTPSQPRRQRDEITSLETFRAILESQPQDDASLKHQTSQMSEESEEENL